MKSIHILQDMLHDNLNPSTTTFGVLSPDQEVALRHAVDVMNAAYMVQQSMKKLDGLTE